MWLVLRKSILTKDNLLRRGWNGSKHCPFCGKDESIDHLFMQCSITRMLSNILKCAFNLLGFTDTVPALFNGWITKFNKPEKRLMVVGVSSVFWTVWRWGNSIVSDNNEISDPCVLVNMNARWINDWNYLQTNLESQETLRWRVKKFEVIAGEVFKTVHGWRMRTNRIMADGVVFASSTIPLLS